MTWPQMQMVFCLNKLDIITTLKESTFVLNYISDLMQAQGQSVYFGKLISKKLIEVRRIPGFGYRAA